MDAMFGSQPYHTNQQGKSEYSREQQSPSIAKTQGPLFVLFLISHSKADQ
jgi:hypothetical protein